jgi:regulator of sirC expression with transglutaminase-like and TPR domain
MVLPLSTSPTSALQYFSTLVAEDAGLPLLEAAVAVAQDDEPGLDPQAVLSELDALAATLRRRLPADAAPMMRLRQLNRYFFQELGFGGNVNDYYDRRNSHLHHVLRTRRGIPITLALLYGELAQQLGLQAQGVSFPGHYLVKLHLPLGEVVLDPFSGRSLSREELEERLRPYLRHQGLVGEFEVPLSLFLQAATPRDTLARLLRNLKEIHRNAGDAPRWLAVQRRLVILLPEDWGEHRDLGLALAAHGDTAAAAEAVALYLARRPEAEDAPALRDRLLQWRAGQSASAAGTRPSAH